MKSRIISLVALVVIGATGCTSTPSFQTGEDAEVTHDGLTRLDSTIMDAVWARPDADIRGVTKVMFEGVGVEYRTVSGPYSGRAGTGSVRQSNPKNEFQLDEETKALFEENMREVFREEVSKSEVFEIVDEPGPDVLLVRGGLLDVVSRVPPETVGRSSIYIDSVAEATLVVEIRDSQSNTVVARAVDRRAAQGTHMTESNRVRNRAEVRRLGRRWGNIMRGGLEKMLTDGLAQ